VTPLAGRSSTRKHVIRGGYGRSYGRTNGVVQVLVAAAWPRPRTARGMQVELVVGGSWACGGSGTGTWGASSTQAFRVGSAASAAGGPNRTPGLERDYDTASAGLSWIQQHLLLGPRGLDPNFRANAIDSFDLTIQRQLNRSSPWKSGISGAESPTSTSPSSLNPVPYMMTQGGQTFANAYRTWCCNTAAVSRAMAGGGCAASAGAVTAQPFSRPRSPVPATARQGPALPQWWLMKEATSRTPRYGVCGAI